MKTNLNTLKRQSYYDYNGVLKPQSVQNVLPSKHTMGLTAFRKYIDRYRKRKLRLGNKKFTKEQNGLLAMAYRHGMPIRVIGAYHNDLDYLLEKNNYRKKRRVFEHIKTGKNFNNHRSSMCLVERKRAKKSGEVWVLVFPSKQYVNQYAALIQCIINDFKIKNVSRQLPTVEVCHFPQIENSIPDWTDFKDFVSLFVRYGDVVAFSNVDLLKPGLADHYFEFQGDNYFHGGLNNMFGVSIAVNKFSKKRLVLVGFKESFWGNAIGQYVRALIDAGARRFLYLSKAASNLDETEVHKLYSPTHFAVVEDNNEYLPVDYTRPDFDNLMMSEGIQPTGIVATVSTVIGEDYQQLLRIGNRGIACTDCEDGHIARVIAEYNRKLSRGNSKFVHEEFDCHFIPVHFTTDYIYKPNQKINNSKGNLSTHADDYVEYREKRDEAFKKIGSFCATYTLMLGTEHKETFIDKVDSINHRADFNFKFKFDDIRPLLNAGLICEANAGLSAKRTREEYLIEDTLAHAVVNQKAGLLSSAYNSVLKLQDKEIVSKLNRV